MVRTFAVGAVVAVGLLGGSLSGCGGTTDAGPPPSPSATPSTSPSASPSPTAPVMPDAARENTKAGAVAFVRHYVDLINHAQATGDTKALAAVEDSRCRSCQSVRRHLRELYAGGGSIRSGDWRVGAPPRVSRNADIHGFTVEVLIRTSDQTVDDGSGHLKHVRGGANILNVFVERAEGSWKVGQWWRAV